MKTFKLPDLGEGLQEAELIEWLIKEGDSVNEDQLVLLVETAKAVVEIPAPTKCEIVHLCAKTGETIKVGQALFDYSQDSDHSSDSPTKRESVSVVGELNHSSNPDANLYESAFYQQADEPSLATPKSSIQKPASDPVCLQTFKKTKTPKKIAKTETSATPTVRAFAKKLGLEALLNQQPDLQLHELLSVYLAQEKQAQFEHSRADQLQDNASLNAFTLKGSRKVMAQVMSEAHHHIPAATLFEDVDVSHWDSKQDITLRLLKAITYACQCVPLLNAWYDSERMSMQVHKSVHIGLAVNAESGLYVPVLRDAQAKSDKQLRDNINYFRQQIKDQRIAVKDMQGATISLSNFGALTGRYATPIVVPPQVAIIGSGKIRKEALVKNDLIVIGQVLPLSLSFDHRGVTGGEAAEFLFHMITSLSE